MKPTTKATIGSSPHDEPPTHNESKIRALGIPNKSAGKACGLTRAIRLIARTQRSVPVALGKEPFGIAHRGNVCRRHIRRAIWKNSHTQNASAATSRITPLMAASKTSRQGTCFENAR